MIKVSLSSNDLDGSFDTEIKENEEIINSPEWFDSNDYKTDLSYEEAKEIVLDMTQFEDWTGAEIFYPAGLMGADVDTTYLVDTSNDYYVSTSSSYNEFCDGEVVYRYDSLGNPSTKHLVETSQNYYRIIYDPTECINNFIGAYQSFFAEDAEFFREYYVAAKKYEKDITVVSFKFVMEEDESYNDAICSLYYDLDNNLQKVDCFTSYKDDSNSENDYALHITMKKIAGVQKPEWFEESDFVNFLALDEMVALCESNNFNNWQGYDFKAEVKFKNNQYLSDGVHFSETASIRKYIDGDKVYSDYISEICASSESKDSMEQYSNEYETEYGSVSRIIYPFWNHNEIENKKAYAKDKIEYTYLADGTSSSQAFESGYYGYKPNVFASSAYAIMYKILCGEEVECFAIPSKEFTFNNNMTDVVLPGEEICFMRCVKEDIDGETKYTIDYQTTRQDNKVVFRIVMYFDEDNAFYKCEAVSNVIVPTKNAETSITITKNETTLNAPLWFNESDFS